MVGLRWLGRALAVLGWIAIALTALNVTRDTSYFFRGSVKVPCLDRLLCVGDAWPSSAIKIDDDRHGLTALFCYRGDGQGTFLFLPDILAGKVCAELHYAVELRNPRYRTVIEIRNGKVLSITNGPLHTLDL